MGVDYNLRVVSIKSPVLKQLRSLPTEPHDIALGVEAIVGTVVLTPHRNRVALPINYDLGITCIPGSRLQQVRTLPTDPVDIAPGIDVISRVVLLLPNGTCEWDDDLEAGETLRMGVEIGELKSESA